MALNLEIIGVNLFAGTDWVFTESLDDYPASLYDLQPLIKTGSESSKDLSAYVTKDGNDFGFIVPNAQTVGYTPGEYYVQYVFTRISDSAIFVVPTNEPLNVRPLLTSSVEYRTYWEQQRDIIKTTIESLNAEVVMSAEYLGRKYTLSNIKELKARLSFAETKLAEERGENFQDDNQFLVRFLDY